MKPLVLSIPMLLVALSAGEGLMAADFQQDYNRAYELLVNARTDEEGQAAIKMFEALTERSDGGKLLPNTWYWLGEANYDRKQFVKALHCFDKALSYPDSYKEEPSRFKVGMCYVRLGWTAEARGELKRFLAKYPESKLINVVRSELAKLPKE